MAKAVNGQAVKGKDNLNKSVPKSVKPAKTDAEEHHNEHHDDVIDFKMKEKRKRKSLFLMILLNFIFSSLLKLIWFLTTKNVLSQKEFLKATKKQEMPWLPQI